jgi:hypothetical protein
VEKRKILKCGESYIIKLEVRNVGSGSVWICLSQNMDQWPVALNTFTELQFSRSMGNSVASCLTVSISKDCVTWNYILYSIIIDQPHFVVNVSYEVARGCNIMSLICM